MKKSLLVLFSVLCAVSFNAEACKVKASVIHNCEVHGKCAEEKSSTGAAAAAIHNCEAHGKCAPMSAMASCDMYGKC